jgi:competence protein ComEC
VGLAVGVYQGLPDAEWELLRRTGTVHLVSVSGFHLTLVALPLALVGAGLATALAGAGWTTTPRVAGAVVALAGATVYGGLAGFSVPTLRSLLTLVAVAACVAGRRGRSVAALLALAAAGALAIDPLGLLTPGFWLSFAGVLALATAFGGTSAPAAAGVPARAGRLLREAVTAQVAAGIALLPLTLAWFGQVSVAGSLANLVAIPFFSLAVLPPVLLGALVASVAPGWATPLFGLATTTLAAWRALLGWFADLPLALVELPVPTPGVLALATAGVVLALWPRPLLLRALAPACLLPLFLARPPTLPAGAFAVTVLDVGQGLAVLVQTRHHALLYDAGPAWGDGDAGDRTVLPVLRQAGVTGLDRFVVSHGDIDHGGGARAVLARYPGTDLLATQWPWPRPPARRRPCRAGEAWQWDGVAFTVLHPDGGPGGPDNEQSCVIAVAGAGGGLLLTGDIGAPSEARLAAAGRLGRADLVIAPHHGSRSSSSTALVDAVRARYVVFTTGFANRWDFPRPDVVARWQAAGACPLTTAETGALRFVATPAAGLRLERAERIAWRPAWRRAGRISRCALRSPGPPVYSGAGLVAP